MSIDITIVTHQSRCWTRATWSRPRCTAARSPTSTRAWASWRPSPTWTWRAPSATSRWAVIGGQSSRDLNTHLSLVQWVKSKFASLKANLNEAQVSIHTANTQVSTQQGWIFPHDLRIYPPAAGPVWPLHLPPHGSLHQVPRHAEAQDQDAAADPLPALRWNLWLVSIC